MSDFLLVRGIDRTEAKRVLDAWKATHKWVRSVELSDVWEPQHLKINGRDAIVYMTGKHKVDLAGLILLILQSGGHVVHLMLHRREAERIEEDLGEWALKKSAKR